MKIYSFFMLLIFSLVLTTSCNKVDCDLIEDENATFEEVFPDESERFNNAIAEYIADPTEDNCEELQDAFEEVLDALEKYDKCAENREEAREFRDDIEEARDDLKDLCE